MAVKLRMRRMGSNKRPFYRIVAADSRFQRDGRFLEILGYYDPKMEPFKFEVNREKVLIGFVKELKCLKQLRVFFEERV